jgi:phage tail sheath gpL-like
MSGPIITIAGFSASDKVPGFFGQTLTGQGPSSLQSVPVLLLCVGIMSTTLGNGALNTPYLMTANSDADGYFGAGLQVSRQVYSALQVTDATVWAIGIAPASGAVAATSIINISGTWSTTGTLSYRINGQTRSITIGATDLPTNVATNIALDVNSQLEWPVTAAAAQLGSTTTYQVTFTHKTAGVSGNNQILAVVNSAVPTGCVVSLTSSNIGGQQTWKATQSYVSGQWANAITGAAVGYAFKCTTGGTSGSVEPTWITTVGSTTTDSSVTWTCEFAILTGGLVPFFGGTGTASASLALAAIVNTQYDRIVPAQSDATNAALWQAQVDTAAGPTTNILEQVIFAYNGTLASAAAIASVTLNDARCSVLWQLNGETHPCEVAAAMGALRSSSEGGNWAQGYDNTALPGVAIQSQVADYPNHSTLVAALNEGVTPIQNYNGQACIVRAITSHSLNGTAPDYSVLDTTEITVPDMVRADIRLYWASTFLPNNPVVSNDPSTSPGGQTSPYPPSGVAMPSTWNAQVIFKLNQYQAGVGFPYPQLELGSVAQFPPVTGFSAAQGCLMSAIPVVPIALQHQIGVSVRGTQISAL